jgi:hypothetical protein
VVLVELVLLLGEEASVLVLAKVTAAAGCKLVRLFGERTPALVGEGDHCWWMQ